MNKTVANSKKIIQTAKKFKSKAAMTSPYHKMDRKNYEAFIKEKINFDLVVDIQGDEPLISPYHIDRKIKFHKKF